MSAAAPAALPVAVGADFEIGDEQEVDDVEGLIRLIDDNRAAAWGARQELRVAHFPIRQVNDEWPKRLGFPGGSKLVGGHRGNRIRISAPGEGRA